MAATSIFYTAKSVRRQPTFSPLDKSRRTFVGAFLTLIVLTSTCAVFYIGTHVQAVNLGYKIGQELQKKERLIEENKRLDLEIARLKSPTRIEEEAKATFGLVLPKTQQVYYLSRWDEELSLKLTAAPEQAAPPPEAAKKPAAEKTLAAAPIKAPGESPKAQVVATKPTSPEKIAGAKKPNKDSGDPAAKPSAPTVAVKAAPKPETPAKVAKSLTPQASPAKVAKSPAVEDPRKSDVEKSDLPVKPASNKALAQSNPAPAKAAKGPAAVPATAKNEPVKPAKAPAAKPPAETKLAKKEGVLVAEKSSKPKPGPALAYQPKEKVPAVMLDPMP